MNKDEQIVKNLTAKDENEAIKAANLLVEGKNVTAFQLLIEKSECLFDFVKINVSNRIKKVCNKENYKNLISFFEFYSCDYDDTIVSILANNADEALTDEMYDLLQNGTESQKTYSAKYFYHIPDTIAEDLLCKNAFSDNEFLLVNCAKALGAMKNENIYSEAIEKLKSDDEFEKLKAVKFLVSYGDKKAVHAIYQTMQTSAMAENIAGELPFLVSLPDLLKSDDKEPALTCVLNIFNGFPEVLPLCEVLDFQIYDVLQKLIKLATPPNSDSTVSVILLKALSKFTLINGADEYTFAEDNLTKNELKNIFELLNSCSEAFWATQKVLAIDELYSNDKNFVTAACDVVREFKIEDAAEALVELTSNADDIIKYCAVTTLAALRKLHLIDKEFVVSNTVDDNLKAIIANCFA